jgi:hypothetical protein
MIGSETEPAKPQGKQSPAADRFDRTAFSVSLPPMIDRNETLHRSKKHSSLCSPGSTNF